MELESIPQSMEGQFSDKNEFENLFMLFGTKGFFLKLFFDFLKFLKMELKLGTPKEITLFSDEK